MYVLWFHNFWYWVYYVKIETTNDILIIFCHYLTKFFLSFCIEFRCLSVNSIWLDFSLSFCFDTSVTNWSVWLLYSQVVFYYERNSASSNSFAECYITLVVGDCYSGFLNYILFLTKAVTCTCKFLHLWLVIVWFAQ